MFTKDQLTGDEHANQDVSLNKDIDAAFASAKIAAGRKQQITIYGFSRGAVFALTLAERLSKAGIDVAFMGLIDPVATNLKNHATSIPSRVKDYFIATKLPNRGLLGPKVIPEVVAIKPAPRGGGMAGALVRGLLPDLEIPSAYLTAPLELLGPRKSGEALKYLRGEEAFHKLFQTMTISGADPAKVKQYDEHHGQMGYDSSVELRMRSDTKRAGIKLNN